MKNDKKRICIECGNVAYIPSGTIKCYNCLQKTVNAAFEKDPELKKMLKKATKKA
jgi:hypothetical protein